MISTNKNVTPYSEFIVENNSMTINEGLFDMLRGMFQKLNNLFKDSSALESGIDKVAARIGNKAMNNSSKSLRIGTTTLVKLHSTEDENIKMILSFTKIADLPDGSGLFQLTGTDNATFLKYLGMKDNTQLNVLGVMAIVNPEGFIKDKPITMRVYKNIMKDGRAIVTENVVSSAVAAEELSKITSEKTVTSAPSSGTPGV